MRIYILGIDGYLGWTLAQYLAKRGHVVAGGDNFFRRDCVSEVGSHTALPIARMTERLQSFRGVFGKSLEFTKGDFTDYNFVWNQLRTFKPDAIVHLAEMPSAPYSMIDVQHAEKTIVNNLIGTLNILFVMRDVCPGAHLVKLGPMGEYGTPNIDIPEGNFELEFRGRKDEVIFPRKPSSLYHATKVHDTFNVEMLCRLWGLCSTDIMQGVVYGTRANDLFEVPSPMMTRFDFDAVFGTAINRFCAQGIIGMPITPYGEGKQKRGFLPLCDSMQCLTLAIENPPDAGEYRVFNQFEEVYNLTELATMVADSVERVKGERPFIRRIENPRCEEEIHYYNPDHKKLLDLGYEPNHNMESLLDEMILDLQYYKERIEAKAHVLVPDIVWDGTRRKMEYLNK